MAYCGRCRIGTIDTDGLCLLCGAPAAPPTPTRRLAEAGGTALSVLLSPAVLGAMLVLAMLVAVATESHFGATRPAAVPHVGLLGLSGVRATLAASHTDPLGAAASFLLPALAQALVFGLLLLLAILLWRRLRQEQPAARGKLVH